MPWFNQCICSCQLCILLNVVEWGPYFVEPRVTLASFDLSIFLLGDESHLGQKRGTETTRELSLRKEGL